MKVSMFVDLEHLVLYTYYYEYFIMIYYYYIYKFSFLYILCYVLPPEIRATV